MKLPRLTPNRLVILVAAAAVGYLLFSAVGDTLLSQRLNDDEGRLQREIDDLRTQQERLVALRDYLRTDAYIEGVARRVLNLVRPGETLVVVSSNAEPTPAAPGEEEQQTDDRTWWEKLYGQ